MSDCRRPSLSSCYAGLFYRAGPKRRAEGSPQLGLQGDTAVHHSPESLYPDWSGEAKAGPGLAMDQVALSVIAQPMFALLPSVRAALEMPV